MVVWAYGASGLYAFHRSVQVFLAIMATFPTGLTDEVKAGLAKVEGLVGAVSLGMLVPAFGFRAFGRTGQYARHDGYDS